MTKDEIESVLFEELGNIAPDIDAGLADPGADIRKEFDIDSI